jgi:hypothetical protein
MRMTTFETDFVKMFSKSIYTGIALLINLFPNQTSIYMYCIPSPLTSCLSIRVFNYIDDNALINQVISTPL